MQIGSGVKVGGHEELSVELDLCLLHQIETCRQQFMPINSNASCCCPTVHTIPIESKVVPDDVVELGFVVERADIP